MYYYSKDFKDDDSDNDDSNEQQGWDEQHYFAYYQPPRNGFRPGMLVLFLGALVFFGLFLKGAYSMMGTGTVPVEMVKELPPPVVQVTRPVLPTEPAATSEATLAPLLDPDLILPDADMVNGPAEVGFETPSFLEGKDGYLSKYSDTSFHGKEKSAGEIIQMVANDFSVNPRLLLAVMEYRYGWVTSQDLQVTLPSLNVGLFPFVQRMADGLNLGFYGNRYDKPVQFTLRDGSVINPPPEANPGTLGIYAYLAKTIKNKAAFEQAVGPQGLRATYTALFGDPFASTPAVKTLEGVTQPTLALPFEPGVRWVFSGGPHPSWGAGSAWGALDFAPLDSPPNCGIAPDWVTAAAPGIVTRSGGYEGGVVAVDMDGDGDERTGWVMIYMHIASEERVPVGTQVQTGDRLGHPSCEGGESTGTHTHITRKFDGEWVDTSGGSIPFNLSGWIARGGSEVYQGWVSDGMQTVAATAGGGMVDPIAR